MKKALPVLTTLAACLFATSVVAEGNRYNLPRAYSSDISAAKAYLTTQVRKSQLPSHERPLLIDVRDVSEHSAGHPDDALSIPYPHIYSRPGKADYIAMDPATFVAAVREAVPDTSRPIYTLCRTGMRSVLAANLLAEAGYTNVHNIWPGFTGMNKVDTAGNALDLNGDGALDGADLDGWSNFEGLPYTTDLDERNIYAPFAYLYAQP